MSAAWDGLVARYVRACCATPGGRVRLARVVRGLSQQELAAAAGISRVALGQIERGQTDPRLSTAVAVAAALGVEPGDLLPETDAHTKEGDTR